MTLHSDMYHIAFPRDAWLTKSLVYIVYVLDTVQTILVTHDAFTYFAAGFGNVDTLGGAQLEWLAVPTISGIGTKQPVPRLSPWLTV